MRLFKTGNLLGISQPTGPQIVVKVSYSCRDWNLIWEGQWMRATSTHLLRNSQCALRAETRQKSPRTDGGPPLLPGSGVWCWQGLGEDTTSLTGEPGCWRYLIKHICHTHRALFTTAGSCMTPWLWLSLVLSSQSHTHRGRLSPLEP